MQPRKSISKYLFFNVEKTAGKLISGLGFWTFLHLQAGLPGHSILRASVQFGVEGRRGTWEEAETGLLQTPPDCQRGKHVRLDVKSALSGLALRSPH